MFSKIASQIFRGKTLSLLSVSRNMTFARPAARPLVGFSTASHNMQIRGFKNVMPKNARNPKTKSAIKKRFIATASG